MSAKTQTKAATKAAKIASPLLKAVSSNFNLKAMHAYIAADFRATVAEGKAGQTVYAAFCEVIKACPLNDAVAMRSTLEDMKLTFGDAYLDKYVIRATILNNARKVAYGGTKDKHLVQGKGMQAVLAVLDGVTSIRDLRKAMSDAKPEQLKESGAGSGTKSKAAKDVAVAKGKQVKAVPGTPVSAIKAALDILATVAALPVFQPGSDADTLELIKALCSKLQTKEIALRMLKAA